MPNGENEFCKILRSMVEIVARQVKFLVRKVVGRDVMRCWKVGISVENSGEIPKFAYQAG